jgi:hypothetical protein
MLSPLAMAEPDVPMIYLNRHSFTPGQTIKIQIPMRGKEPPTLTWENKVFTFLQTPDHFWRVLVPVPKGKSQGRETLYINVNNPMPVDLIEGPLDIKILASEAGNGDVLFTDEKTKSSSNPKEEEESTLIREMIKASVSDPEQRWEGLFLSPDKTTESVLAPNSGLILLVKEFNIHGKTILISHGQGVASLYTHLTRMEVKEGDKIKKGQKIGEGGHWEFFVQGESVDPLQWFEEQF